MIGALTREQAEKLFYDHAVFIKNRDVIEEHVAKELLGKEAFMYAKTGEPGTDFNGFGIGGYTLWYLTKEGFLMGVTYNNIQAYKKAYPEE